MSLIPAFELGVWNAWILAIPGFLLPWIPSLLHRDVVKKRMEEINWSQPSKTVRAAMIMSQGIILPFTLLYSVFLPLQGGTLWFPVGLLIALLGISMPILSGLSLYSAKTPLDQPVTTGLYRITRNPEYFALFLQYLGIGISAVSWVFLLCAILWIISAHIQVVQSEEPVLLKKYGDAYKEYLRKTPRWIRSPTS